jgi:GNAT superfamily N-acetyltransferase
VSDAVRIRPASPDDLPAIAAVLAANGGSMSWPDRPGWPYLEHLLGRGRVDVAELGGEVVAFAGAVRVGEAVMLSDLFVDPARHGRGVGRALLATVLDDAWPRLTFSSSDPRALPLYVRAGMRPSWPVLYVEAEAGVASGLPVAGDVTIETASLEETVELARAESGIDRRLDFAHYASLPDASGFAVRQGGRLAAVGWARRNRVRPGRWLDHATIARDADPVQAALGALRAAAPAGERLAACVPGPNPALAALLEAGFRIFDRDTYCASDPGWLDPERILPNPGFL